MLREDRMEERQRDFRFTGLCGPAGVDSEAVIFNMVSREPEGLQHMTNGQSKESESYHI